VVPLTIVIIIILLYLNFRAISEVFMIILTLPMAMIGGLWLLYLQGFNLSIAVGVGFVALAGVAVEIAVIILVYLNKALAGLKQNAVKHQVPIDKEAYRQALLEVAVLRVRPVMMTVATIIIGLLPIMLGSGTGSEVMSRIATPLVGGMTSALVLTLVVLPVVYALAKKRSIDRHNRQINDA
jgi:Cu(I)/Ag(I) efflux system membrane protein CusA/SilA